MNQFCSEAQPFTLFFFILAKKTMILHLHLPNWSNGDQSSIDLNCTATPSSESLISLRWGTGEEEELTVPFVLSCIDSK